MILKIPAPLFSCEQVKNPEQFAMAILLVKADLHITNHEKRSLKKINFLEYLVLSPSSEHRQSGFFTPGIVCVTLRAHALNGNFFHFCLFTNG